MTDLRPVHTGDPIADGLALIQYHSMGLDMMGEIDLRILRQIQAGYEAAVEALNRAKAGHTPPPPVSLPGLDFVKPVGHDGHHHEIRNPAAE